MNQTRKFPIGLRTLKTVAAVILSMMVVDLYGATASKLIFAMLGAMAVVQPTFKDSLETCIAQIVGVLFGGVAGVLLRMLPLPQLVTTGIGIVLVIMLYNLLHFKFSPSLPCFIVVMLCISPDLEPIPYALGRIWDTAIGLGIGMLINTLIFPYDNRRRIRSTIESLDREVILFLEDMFDGDNILPDAEAAVQKIDNLERELQIFSHQFLWMRPRRYRSELQAFLTGEDKARQLLAHMEVLCRMTPPGRLTAATRTLLTESGAVIRDERAAEENDAQDTVTNYHVEQILLLRRELLAVLGQ